MKTKKAELYLEDNEYLVKGRDPTSPDYKVYYKDELLKDVTAIVRVHIK